MKILKIFGIVAGIHAIALILIFANPGCSSTAAAPPSPVVTAPKAEPAPVVSLPGGSAPAADSAGPIVAAPDSSNQEAPVIAAGLFSPTRPGTLAAGALETQPVADVTPVTTTIVGKGDSLWSIAKRNHIKVSALAKANGISLDTPLHLGQKLIIPGAAPAGSRPPAAEEASPARSSWTASAPPVAAGSTKYRVKPGETFSAIAHKLKVKMSDLAAANNISDPQKIYAGEELVIPGRGTPPSPAMAGYGATNPPSTDSQDLDAGLKPAAAGEVPAIKTDDAAAQPDESKQQ